MKKILVFLLISAVVYASLEEYEDVSLELSKDSHKTTVHTDKSHSAGRPTSKVTSRVTSRVTSKVTSKPTSKLTSKLTSKTTSKNTSKLTTTQLTKPNIMKNKHPFKEIKVHLNDLQRHMNKPKPPLEQIAEFIKGKALQAFQNLSHGIQNGIHWLQKNGFWEPIKAAAKNFAQPALTKLCSSHLPSGLCDGVIGFVFDAVLQ